MRSRTASTPLRAALLAGLALVLVAALWAAWPSSLRAQSETGILANLISRALSTPASQVTIGAIDGALSSDATVRNLTIADRDGVWLRLDRARLVWRRAALLSRRLEIERLEVGRLEVLRRPLPAEGAAPNADEPLLPELPVKVQARAFSLAELALGEPVVGTPARLGATGSAELGDPSEGLSLTLDARRLDSAGRFAARLAFVPSTQRLDLTLDYDEPAGGLLARIAELPGLPPVRLDLQGQGVLDDWRAMLVFRAGGDIGAQGQARLARAGAARRLTLDLAAQIEGLLPPVVAPVFSGTTRVAGSVGLADSGAIAIDGLDLASRTANLRVAGSVSADRVLDLTATARALPTEGGVTRAAGAEIETLVFDGSVMGPLAAPRVTGRLAAAGVRLPQGRLARLDADLSAEPTAADTTRFAVRADATASGLAPTDAALARAIGDRLALSLAGVWNADGVGDVERLTLITPTLDASYRGRLGVSVVDGALNAKAPRLAAFAELAGRPGLTGALTLTARLSGVPGERVRADLDADARSLAVGQPIADRLLGGRVTLKGGAEVLADGVAFQDLRLDAAHLDARIDGRATQTQADLGLTLALSDLKQVDERLAGQANGTARLTGSLARPDLTATLTAANARALGRPLRDVALKATAKDVTGALDAQLALSGAIGDEPLAGTLRLRRPGGEIAWSLDALDLRVGSAAIAGRAALDAAGLAEGALTIAAPDLDDLSPLVLTPLSGGLEAEIGLSRTAGRQDARLVATGRRLRAADATLAAFDANARVTDLYGRPVIDGRLSADRLVAGGETFEEVRLTAVGTSAASDLTLAATARGFALDAAARLVPGERTRIAIASLSARRGERRFALAGPAAVTLEGRSALISDFTIAANGGRVTVAGRVGDRLDLDVAIRALPLSIVGVVQPGLDISGQLDGKIALTGSAAAPDGRYELSVARLVVPQAREAGLPPLDAKASGTLQDGRAGVNATVNAGRAAQLRVSGSVPLDPGGSLGLAVTGTIDAALANASLVTSGQRLTGRIALDASLDGTLAAPRVEGSATLAGGTFTDPLQGIRLTAIQGRLTGQGDTVTIERLTAATRNGGTIAVSGRVELDPQAGFPGRLSIDANRAELVSSDIVTAVANLDLDLMGPLARRPIVGGRVEIVSMDVSIPDRLPATVRPLPGTRHIAPPPAVRARLAAARKAEAERGRGSAAFDATLDLTIVAQNRIFVRGRGIDAELGGELRLTGTSRDPVAVGAFDLRRGRLTLVGQRLDFSRGRLSFTGDLAPDLDFVAETRAGDVLARVAVSGPAGRPDFALTSEPDLPQDEVLSRLLFQKASGGLSPVQALQLAQAVAQLSGAGDGPDVFDQARRSLGLDSLDITAGAGGGVAVGASRYISDRVSVGVRAGARQEDSAATVTIDVTRRLKVQGEVGADGRSSLGVGAEWEY